MRCVYLVHLKIESTFAYTSDILSLRNRSRFTPQSLRTVESQAQVLYANPPQQRARLSANNIRNINITYKTHSRGKNVAIKTKE